MLEFQLIEQTKALVYLKHYVHEDLKFEYLLIDDPKKRWDNLKNRLKNLQFMIAPIAQREW